MTRSILALLFIIAAGCAAPRTFNVRDDSQRYAADGTPQPPIILDEAEWAMKHRPDYVGIPLTGWQREMLNREYVAYVQRQQRTYDNARTYWLDTLVVSPAFSPATP